MLLYNILQYSLLVAALLFGGVSFLFKQKRGVLIWAAASAAFGAISAHYHVFWSLALFTMMVPWALVCVGDWIDISWRLRTGFCVFLAFTAALSIYPTYIDERYNAPDLDTTLSPEAQAAIDTQARDGELGFGRFIRSNIPFRLVRGLDLKGGLRLLYNVDVQEAIKDKREHYYYLLRSELARAFGITKEGETANDDQYKTLSKSVIVEKAKDDVAKVNVTFVDPADASKINDAFKKRFRDEMDITPSADKKTVTFAIKQDTQATIRQSAVAQAQDTIHRRIDGLGLKEAGVSPEGDENIVVEVPGSDERAFTEIKDIIAQTARLEFKMVDDDSDFMEKVASEQQSTIPSRIVMRSNNGPIGEGKTHPIVEATIKKEPNETMAQALKVLQDWTSTLKVPDGNQIAFAKMYDYDSEKEGGEEIGWYTMYLRSQADVTGDMITEAQVGTDQGQSSGVPKSVVNLEFNPVGADSFGRATSRNIGRRFAILLDDKVESAPVIQSAITGGSCQITMGSQTQQEQMAAAKKLVLVLKAGALPAPIASAGSTYIGPSLGADAIRQGLKGAGFGGLLVVIMMLVIYVRAGVIANIAVTFNLILQLAALAMFGASMTLPGIAGLALTVGIAVDANVLINERIRDELRTGKSARSAVDVGYDRAFTAILDGHVTQLISGLILMQYGTGPIKGFAITLIVGVLVSLFTGVVCTRLMFDWAVRFRKVKKLSLG